MENVYKNISELRKVRRFSQTDLAEKLGINQDTYSKLERGKIQLTIERLEQLAGIFGMSVIELLNYGGVESMKEDNSEKVRELEKEIGDLKKDLEIRDLKLQRYEQVKEVFFYNAMFDLIGHIIINDFWADYDSSKEMTEGYIKDYFTKRISNLSTIYNRDFFEKNVIYFIDTLIKVNISLIELSVILQVDVILNTEEFRVYMIDFYENSKIVLDSDKIVKIANFKHNKEKVGRDITDYWQIVKRNKSDKSFFEFVNTEIKQLQ